MADQISDVFISYAHADDVPSFGETFGWITILVDELKKNLNSKLDRKVLIWKDEELAANDKVTDTLVDRVRHSRTLVLFLSNAYLRSTWCQKELGTFLDHNRERKNKENVFIVELDAMEDTRNLWHPRLQELTPIRFWKNNQNRVPQRLGWPIPKPGDDDYWTYITTLTHLIATHLKSCAAPVETATTDVPLEQGLSAQPTVWIAEPTDDLIDDWESLAESIRQAKYNLLPVGIETYPKNDPALYSDKLKAELEASQLYIQLLSQFPGRKTKDGFGSFTALQAKIANDTAKRRQLPFLQWRSKEIKLDAITDEAYRQLLTGATASGFEEFRQNVLSTLVSLRQAKETPERTRTRDESIAICISADRPDQELCSRIRDILVDLGADALTTPLQVPGQMSSEFIAQLNEVISGSEGFIIVYGQASPLWVQAQYNQARKALLGQQRKGIWGALLDGPPQNKTEAGIASKNLMLLDCRDGPERKHIERFVNSLREAVGNA